jgi:hypothetical protein
MYSRHEYLEIAPTPVEEACQQVGTPSYDGAMARAECKAFIHQLRRQFGPEPDGATLYVKSNPHDFGSYLEVAVKYDPNCEAAIEYAFKIEGNTPSFWDTEAVKELQDFRDARSPKPMTLGAVLDHKRTV